MKAAPPIIAVVSTRGEDRNANYLRALEQHGAAWRLAKPEEPLSLDGIHGLLLTGGGDLTEAHYAHAPDAAERATLGRIEPEREAFELRLLAWAAERDLPVLGICRGLQVMGAFAGGRLIPDLPVWKKHHDPGAREVVHRGQEGDVHHAIEVAPGSRLSVAMKTAGKIEVNSHHHQALVTIPPGLVAGATAADGILEAIENPRCTFWLGVQFHPERMTRNEEVAAALFASFLQAARGGIAG
ncbi:MAG: gamma-glutamyl-gamma-aminobutyrate hydrolase family protein [Verrucomicrobiae bacterium]|nr:gamma-glutamyl-gamma-aminobutyrate hydrolase family protein [Verrucomicrobiae bacterium]